MATDIALAHLINGIYKAQMLLRVGHLPNELSRIPKEIFQQMYFSLVLGSREDHIWVVTNQIKKANLLQIRRG